MESPPSSPFDFPASQPGPGAPRPSSGAIPTPPATPQSGLHRPPSAARPAGDGSPASGAGGVGDRQALPALSADMLGGGPGGGLGAPIPGVRGGRPPAGAPKHPTEGYAFGRYQLHEELGRGASGAVFRSIHPDLNVPVAVKILNDDLKDNDRSLMRFKREGEIMTGFDHDAIVKVYEAGTVDDRHFLVMEFVEGHSLDWLLDKKRALSLERTLEIAEAVCEGGHHAHEQGIVHRDLKPDNIMLVNDEIPKLTDFGLAKTLDMKLTADGAAIGTPYYMSPEQLQGVDDVDRRADVYALGVVMYRMLTGRLPYKAGSSYELYDKVLKGDAKVPSALNRKLDEQLDAVVMKAMHKDRDKRYASLKQMAQDISRLRKGQKPLYAGRSRGKSFRFWKK